jgi:hypothetical protein
MERGEFDRRAVLAGLGGAVVGTLIASRAPQAAPPQPQGMQAVLDKIARTTQGFGESCLPVQAFPGTGTSAFRLTLAGSYYLNGNVVVTGGENGIEIAGNNIDLDLQGYSVIGPSGAAGVPAGTGIVAAGTNIAVYDGSVANFSNGVDFGGASYSMVWDVTAIDATQAGFLCGSFNQHYDTEAHRCLSGVGYEALGVSSQIHECGAFSCAVGFRVLGAHNLVLANSATDCALPFDIRAGNAWGPIVVVQGDMSLVPKASDVNANLAY